MYPAVCPIPSRQNYQTQFPLQQDTKIDVQAALRIFEHYRQGTNGLKIWTNGTLLGQVEGNPVLHLSLEVKQYQTCNACGRTYISKHTCNADRQVYKKIKEGKNRFV